MNHPFLTLRISRRAIGAAQLTNDALTLADGRHLTSRSDRAVVAVANWLEKLLNVTKPACLVVDSPPRTAGGTTDRIMKSLETAAAGRGIPVLPVVKPELLSAYGLQSLRSRRELRELARSYWPELAHLTGKVEPYVVDAAAAALYAECRLALERIPA